MSEKQYFLSAHQRECQTTLNLLKAFPASKADLKPAEKSRNAKELAFVLANQELFFKQAIEGAIDFAIFSNQPPATIADVISVFEKNSKTVDTLLEKTPDAELEKNVNFGGQDMRRLDALWGNLFDLVHHRGQFSVYVRMAGAKMPSIYGPSADTEATTAKKA